jgi:predicted nucleic acid-binding protein
VSASTPKLGDVLLDTSVIIPYFKKDASVHAHFVAHATLYLPLTELGELYCGVHTCDWPEKELAKIQTILPALILLVPSETTAECYGQIYGQLSKAGVLIPSNDIWVAAFALEYQLPLAVRDAHFNRITGIQVLMW